MELLRNTRPRSEISMLRPKVKPQQSLEQVTDTSLLSVPLNSQERSYSLSVHDLRSNSPAPNRTESEVTGSRRTAFRNRKNRRLDESILGHPKSEEQGVKNLSFESMPDHRSASHNHLAVPFDVNAKTHGSTEFLSTPPKSPPEPLQGILLKNQKRPMKGWHERFFQLNNGCLAYAKNQTFLLRERNKTQIDLANTFVTSDPEKLQIVVNASTLVCHLKFQDAVKFHKWLMSIKLHRLYDQYQNGLSSTGRHSDSRGPSSGCSNISGDGLTPSNTYASLPPTWGSAIAQMHSRTITNTPHVSPNMPANRSFSQHISEMEKLIHKLNNAYNNLEELRSSMTNVDEPGDDGRETENSSPTRSCFFSPLPIGQSVISAPTHHSRIGSDSSVTSMCTAVQAPSSDVNNANSTIQNKHEFEIRSINFVVEAGNFSNQAKSFIDEATEALALMNQMQLSSSVALAPCKEANSTLTMHYKTRPHSYNERMDTDYEFERHSARNSTDKPLEDIPVLTESNMNVPDMKGVVVKNPEPVAGRRTSLPARQSNYPTFSLMILLKSNIGRDLTKMRLPAILNEPLGILQNLCEEMEYSQLLDAASEATDRTQRMLFVATFAISAYTGSANRTATKSFDPLLGETFECIRPEKQWRFLAEQVNNNPPTSVAHCESKNWNFDQEYGIKFKFWGKSLEVNAVGGCQLEFPRWRETYTWNKVTTSITNLVSTTGRSLDHHGDMLVQCSNGVTAAVQFTKNDTRRPDTFRSVYGTVRPPSGALEPPRLICGRWDKILVSKDENNENRCIWRANPLPPNSAFYYGFTRFAIELNELPTSDAVPSGHLPVTDTRLRPDIRFLELGRFEDAEAENKRLEDDQRHRLKLYNSKDAEGNSTWKPFWFNPKTIPPFTDEPGCSYEFNPSYWRFRESGGFKDLKLPLLW